MATFADCLALTDVPGGTAVELFEDWGQGRTAFGGLVAAWFVACAREGLPAGAKLRSIDISHQAAVPVGVLTVHVEQRHAGARMIFSRMSLRRGKDVLATATTVHGAARKSRIAIATEQVPLPDPQGGVVQPFLPGKTPAFTQHFEFRWTRGQFPFSGAKDAQLSGFCRHRTPVGGDEELVSLMDAWPVPLLSLGDAPFPASSLRWSVQLVGDAPLPDGDRLWFFDSKPNAAGDGFASTTDKLFATDGTLCAVGQQLVALYDRV